MTLIKDSFHLIFLRLLLHRERLEYIMPKAPKEPALLKWGFVLKAFFPGLEVLAGSDAHHGTYKDNVSN